MNTEAVKDFVFFTNLSFDYGIIDLETYFLRRLSLYDLNDIPFDKKIFPKYILHEFYRLEGEVSISTEGRNFEGRIGEIMQTVGPNGDALSLYTTKKKGKFCNWVFYDLDVDPRPSVPHGHGVEIGYYKLDPYCRFIYDVRQGLKDSVDREHKKYIKALWNDNQFRSWALWAIKEFINSGELQQRYNWLRIRGIKNPLKLPRKK
jgi:hypothetical protein